MDHDQYIREHYETMSDKEIAAVLGRTELSVKNRRQRMGLRKSSQGVRPTSPNEKLSKIAELLEKNNIPVEEIGKVEKVRIGTYQMLTKNDEGEAEVHDLEVASLVMSPTWADGPEWPVVQQARPCVVKPAVVKKVKRAMQMAVTLPDPQIGYRRDVQTGHLIPFHDEKAMAVALQFLRDNQPDLIINLGDFLDLAPFGKYAQEAGFALTTQAAIDRGHKFLAEQRAACPNARIVVLEGNHDRRMQNAIMQNALAALHIQRANAPESWPVLSVPFLCRFDELGVEYVDGYPAGEFWINDRLVCIHGYKIAPAGKTAAKVVNDERVSVIFGHVHRIEMTYKTMRVRNGYRTNLSVTPGCLCRIDGAVPSVKGATDLMGRAITAYENWQQGFAVVFYEEGDGDFAVQPVYINDGQAIYNGTTYKA